MGGMGFVTNAARLEKQGTVWKKASKAERDSKDILVCWLGRQCAQELGAEAMDGSTISVLPFCCGSRTPKF